jgi:arylsulfatase A-like enzyme
LGYGDTGYAGHPHLKTPALDQMAKQGVRLELFYSAGSNCSPTRASIITGQNHNRCRVYDWGEPIRADAVTIAHALKANGYATAHYGKWHLGGVSAGRGPTPKDMGFDEFFSTQSNGDKVDPKGFYHNCKPVDTKGEVAEIIMNQAIGWIHKQADAKAPFLIYMCFHAPHKPYGSTPKYLAMYKGLSKDAAAYLGSITAMDDQIGRLRAELQKMGIAENTLIWFSSDNGSRGEGSDRGLEGSKGSLSEGGTRVPSVVEWPGVFKAAFIDKIPFTSTDLYPTFMAIVGQEKFGRERIIDGENMLPILMGETQERKKPVFFWHRGEVAIHQGRYKYYADAPPSGGLKKGASHEITIGGKGLGGPAPAAVEEAMKKELLKWMETVLLDSGRHPPDGKSKGE